MMNKIFLSLSLIISFLNSDFIRNSENNVIIDTSTNLVWQDAVINKNTVKEITDANTYCNSLEINTLKNWRLPNFNELYSLIELNKTDIKMNDKFINKAAADYWTSTPVINSDHNITGYWTISFANGHDSTDYFTSLTRCVHQY